MDMFKAPDSTFGFGWIPNPWIFRREKNQMIWRSFDRTDLDKGPCIWLQILTSWWWFQPVWKICSSNFIISPNRGKHKTYSKPPPRFDLKIWCNNLWLVHIKMWFTFLRCWPHCSCGKWPLWIPAHLGTKNTGRKPLENARRHESLAHLYDAYNRIHQINWLKQKMIKYSIAAKLSNGFNMV